jgi:hypothetical protein
MGNKSSKEPSEPRDVGDDEADDVSFELGVTAVGQTLLE